MEQILLQYGPLGIMVIVAGVVALDRERARAAQVKQCEAERIEFLRLIEVERIEFLRLIEVERKAHRDELNSMVERAAAEAVRHTTKVEEMLSKYHELARSLKEVLDSITRRYDK